MLGVRGGEWSAARSGRTLPPERTQYPLYRRLGWPQGRSGRAENLAPTGIQSPDRPARSQSLYRLTYSAHYYTTTATTTTTSTNNNNNNNNNVITCSKIIQNIPLRYNVSYKLSGGSDPYCLLDCVW